MSGPLRWMKRGALAVILLAAIGKSAQAQYYFDYSVFRQFTSGGDGTPFSDLACKGTTSDIFYDSDPNTNTPKFANWCPAIGTTGGFGVQFSGILYALVDGTYDFYVGADDGAALYIDGQQVLDYGGDHPFINGTVQVPLTGRTTYSYLLNYYAKDDGVNAIQATVDPRVNVGKDLPGNELLASTISTPEPATNVMLATGLVLLLIGHQIRRRKRQAA